MPLRSFVAASLPVTLAVTLAAAADVDFLMLAAESGDTVELSMVIKSGIAVNTRGHKGVTALMCSAAGRNAKTARYLLGKGADALAVDSAGADVLDWALANAGFEVARLVVERGADVNRVNRRGYTRITAAALRNDLASVRFLLDNGASTTLRSSGDLTVQKAAKVTGNTTLRELLATYRPPAARPALVKSGDPPSRSDYFTDTRLFVDDVQKGRRSFCGAMFRGVDFARLVLSNLDLSGSEFHDCDFLQADLTGANLRKARFYRCGFKSAVLRDTDVSEGVFVQPNFAGADLVGVKGLSLQQLRTVVSMRNARLDENLEDYLRENNPELLQQ